MRPCGNPDPHGPHDFARWDDEALALITQDRCPGVPPLLHGHGGGPHPDACFECWKEVQDGRG